MLIAALAGCATTTSPTYTDAGVRLAPCPRAPLRPFQGVRIPFTVVNRSHRVWPATYVLFSLQQAAKGQVHLLHVPNQPIGGGVRRVTSALRPGGTIHGAVNVYLDARRPGVVNVGAWGAPGNSVAVPSSYENPGCTLRP